jgi:hypothetical protein
MRDEIAQHLQDQAQRAAAIGEQVEKADQALEQQGRHADHDRARERPAHPLQHVTIDERQSEHRMV